VGAQTGFEVQPNKVRLSPQMKPLLGGHLYWTVDRDFMKGGGHRKVQFVLKTAFEMDKEACTYNKNQEVACQGDKSQTKPANGAADIHGVLCIKMVRHTDKDAPEVVTGHIAHEDGSLGACPYVYNEPRTEEDKEKCYEPDSDPLKLFREQKIKCFSNVNPVMTGIQGRPYHKNNEDECKKSGGGEYCPIVGVENKFKIRSKYEEENVNEVSRKLNGRNIVVGLLVHTVVVPEDVTGIIAYLAGPEGTVIDINQGMLLTPCTYGGGQVDLLRDSNVSVMCSHNTETIRDGVAGMIRAPGFHSASDIYWNNFLSGAKVPAEDLAEPLPAGEVPGPWRLGQMNDADTYDGLPGWDNATRAISPKMWHLAQQAPALETYVALCAQALVPHPAPLVTPYLALPPTFPHPFSPLAPHLFLP
jgi:hypothetical protein